jgi:large subunit ribosomal protein L25
MGGKASSKQDSLQLMTPKGDQCKGSLKIQPLKKNVGFFLGKQNGKPMFSRSNFFDGWNSPIFLPNSPTPPDRMKNLKLTVSPRETRGRAKARKLRNEEKIPAVIYSEGNSRLCSVPERDFVDLRKAMAGSASLVELDEGGKSSLTLIKDFQRNAITRKFVHIDFLEVAQDKEFNTSVRVVLTGESVGVKKHDGILQQLISEVPVRCLPKDLPSIFELDVTNVNLGESLSVKDLPSSDGVTIGLDDDQLIMTVTGSAGGRAAAVAAQAKEEGKESE